MDFDSTKEQIRDAVDIVALVSRYVPLHRAGRLFVGRCPWHDDSKPSLQVNPERQSYKCWVCNIGGDIFSFVMKVENVDFPEALRILADIAQIQLPTRDDRVRINKKRFAGNTSATSQQNSETTNDDAEVVTKTKLYQAMMWTAERYHSALQTLDEAESARRYLTERGINNESVVTFRLGYAPLARDWFLSPIGKNPHRLAILEKVGVLAISDRNDYYERFRGRLMFPIGDMQDRIVALGGRVLPGSPNADRAKYINSPETPIFSKHRLLYGLDLARDAIRKTGRVLIMEGYTDVIVAHQYGFRESVAVLGTALGAEHIRILKRFTDKMILVLDGDDAGRKRASEVLAFFVAQGVDVAVLTLPDGDDPADFLHKHGPEGLTRLIENETRDAMTHAFNVVTEGINLQTDLVAASRALDKILTTIAQAPSQISDAADPMRLRIEMTIQVLSQRFGVAEKEIRRRLKQHRLRQQQSAERSTSVTSNNTADDITSSTAQFTDEDENGLDLLEREMLELWIADPRSIDDIIDKVPATWFRSPITRAICARCMELSSRDVVPDFERLMLSFDDPAMKRFLVSIDESGRAKRMLPPVTTQDSQGNPITHEPQEREITPEWRLSISAEIVRGLENREHRSHTPQEIGKLREAVTTTDRLAQLKQIQNDQRERRQIATPSEREA
ncbi:MAG: DNA primase [Thermoguttaceae bacterium]